MKTLSLVLNNNSLVIDSCMSCGLCCCNKSDPKWIEVTEDDLKKLPEGSVVAGDITKYAMKQDLTGRCIYLEGSAGVKCLCQIYENRPTICKAVEMGSSTCLMSIKREFKG